MFCFFFPHSSFLLERYLKLLKLIEFSNVQWKNNWSNPTTHTWFKRISRPNRKKQLLFKVTQFSVTSCNTWQPLKQWLHVQCIQRVWEKNNIEEIKKPCMWSDNTKQSTEERNRTSHHVRVIKIHIWPCMCALWICMLYV